jgi:hypothetical protein
MSCSFGKAMRPSRRAALFLCPLVLLFAAIAAAQNRSTAEISGTVTDPSGAVLPGVKITVQNTATQVIVHAESSAAGLYRAPLLPPGVYNLTFEHPGFQTVRRNGINLALDQTARIDVTMLLGATQAVVEVTAAPPLIEADKSERATNFTSELTQNLPLVGRDPSKLAILAPGTSTAQQTFSSPDPGRVNVNGNRAFTIQATVNGGSSVLPNSNNFSAFVPPLSAVSEFTVINDNFSAEFGNGTSVLNMITKSGTNEFHGSLFEFVQNDVLNARYTFSQKKDKLRYNQFGGAIGGPIRKDRLFFFFSYQNTLNPNTTSGRVTVPTAAAKNGDLSAYGVQIIDPATGQPFPGNQIPVSRFDPVAKNALSYWPDPNLTGLTNNFYSVYPNNPQSPYYDAKVDYNISPAHQLSGTFHMFDWNTHHTGQIPGPACYGGEYCGREGTRDQQWQLSHRWTVSPTAINEFHANFVREHYEATSPSFEGDFPNKLGLSANVPGYYFPSFSIRGALPTSLGAGQHYSGTQNNFIYGDNFSWVKGRHTLKFGGQFMASQHNPHGDWGSGSFGFSGLFTGLGFADFLLGLPESYSLSASPQSLGARRKSAAAFLQDTWRVTSNFTLTLGLRYQYEGGWTEAHNRLANFDPSAINPATGTPGAIVYATEDNPYLQTSHAKLFAPRIGAAYSLPKDTVVRAAYGIFFIPNGAQQGFNANVPGYGISQNLQTTDQRTPVFQLSAGPPPYVYPDASVRNGAVVNGANINWWPYDAPQPYVQQWQFGIQKQLGAANVVEIAYVGNKGVHLLFPREANQVPPQLWGPGDAQPRRPFPQYRNITTRFADGDSIYHALQIKGTRRLSNGLTFLANYTFSKSIDNSSYDTTTGAGNLYQIATNTALNRGLSQFDQTHRVVLSYVYDVPVGRGRKWLSDGGVVDAILGGWQTSGSFVAHSGIPFTVLSGAPNQTGAISGYVYADCLGDPSVADPSAARWFNTAAFGDPAPFRFGTCGRNTLRGPGSWNLDAALMKNFKIPMPYLEGATLQFRADAFNILNHANLSLPNSTTGSTAFGTITSASDPRVFQIGVQFLF